MGEPIDKYFLDRNFNVTGVDACVPSAPTFAYNGETESKKGDFGVILVIL